MIRVKAGRGKGHWRTFGVPEGLLSPVVMALLQDRAGGLWFGTLGGGVSRYDEGRGQPGGLTVEGRFTTFTTREGLANNDVWALLEDQDGHLWLGTPGGVSRYDEEGGGSARRADSGEVGQPGGLTGEGRFTTFTTREGLVHNQVWTMLEDRAGQLWFGTLGGGVSRYDEEDGGSAPPVPVYGDSPRRRGQGADSGGEFTTFTAQDGLAHNVVLSILEDRLGHLWFGTFGGGVSLYDGLVFQTLRQADGLASNTVQKVFQACNGDIWIATEGGVTRYRPRANPPALRLAEVVADRRYDPAAEIHLPSSQRLVVFEFRGRSFMTPSEQMAYAYRLEGYDRDWRWTRERRVEYMGLPLGEYLFQVTAVDQHLNYSDVTEVRLTVIPDPRIEGLTEALRAGGSPGDFIGESTALRKALAQIEEVAKADMTVLILGETGTGKGLVARAIHGLSARHKKPFLPVNCGTIPEGLAESELFGHEKGAFTGAVARRLGRFELAEGGTLFLDEIGDLPLAAQVKLLRFLEERAFERVGGEKTLEADVRVIAATNRDLEQMMKERQFREDIYFRLKEFSIRVPPLRERREDIPLLVRYFIGRFADHLNRPEPRIAPGVMERLQGYTWPGNVRELEHLVQRAVLSCRDNIIRMDDLSGVLLEERRLSEEETFVSLEEHECRYLEAVLEAADWVIYGPQGAAQLLGMHPERLRGLMRKHGLRRPR